MAETQAATATGNFSKTPFSHILVYLFEKRLSGTLEVRCNNNAVSIYFRDGVPAKVQTDVPRRGLGHVLAVLGRISEAQLAACNAHVQTHGGLQGKALTALRILDVNGLVQGLKQQIVIKMTDVFAMGDASYAFFANVNKLTGFGPDEVFPVHPYTVIMSGLRTYADKLDLSPVLSPLDGRRLSAVKEMERLRAFRLSTQEKQFLQYMLTNAGQYPQLISAGPWKPETAQYVIYALRITKLLVITDADAASPKSTDDIDVCLASIPPISLDSADPAVAAQKRAVMTKAEELADRTYYEMLGIDEDASTEDIRRAYFVLSKQFHPDRLHKDVNISLKDAVHYVFSNLTEAHTVLMDPAEREKYDAAMREEKQDADRRSMNDHMAVRDALEAENLFQRAVVFLNKGEIAKSAELVESSLVLSPEEGEYLALAAHIGVLQRGSGEPLIDLEKKLRQAAAQCPRSEKVNFYMADVLKRQEKWAEAKAYFKKILQVNPRNIDAAREVRLIEMRDKKSTGPQKSLIKRLLK